MKCFRCVLPLYGEADSIFQGSGAAIYPGRWNSKGVRCIYASTTLEVAVCEQAFHSLLFKIEQYNAQVGTNGRKPPTHFYNEIIKVPYRLAEVELAEGLPTVDLTSDIQLQQQLSKYGMPQKSLADARAHSYRLPQKDMWTRKLGTALEKDGVAVVLVPSARSDAGKNIFLFEDNLSDTDYKIKSIWDVEVSALSVAHKPLRPGEIASLSHVWHKSQMGEGRIEILRIEASSIQEADITAGLLEAENPPAMEETPV